MFTPLTEIAYSNLGFPTPAGAYHPLADPRIPEVERGLAFGEWVSSYYSHPHFSSKSATPARVISALQTRTPTRPVRPATMETISPEDLVDSIDLAPGPRSEHAVYVAVRPETLHEQFTGALTPAAEDVERLLPRLTVRIVYCTGTIWSIIWGVWELEKMFARWKEEGKPSRPTELVRVDDENHFVSPLSPFREQTASHRHSAFAAALG